MTKTPEATPMRSMKPGRQCLTAFALMLIATQASASIDPTHVCDLIRGGVAVAAKPDAVRPVAAPASATNGRQKAADASAPAINGVC